VATGYLLDSNILLRLTSRDSALHAHIQRAVRQILQQDVSLFCCPQNVVELWNVLTRPIDRNGFGLSITEAEEEIQLIEREFGFLPDNQQIHAVWRRLVYDHRVRGRQVHDARLVAVMRVYGLSHLLTLNRADFARYGGITVIDPSDFATSE
jgi:predicted nucleic acid-binding protein